MKTAPHPADAVEQAATEAAEADALLAALEERVRDGDDTVTPAQLASTRELGTFAKLRAEAARRKASQTAAAAAEQERAATIEQAAALVAEQGAPARVAAAYEAARIALAELLAVTTTHDDAVREAAQLLRTAGASPMHRYVPVQHDGYVTNESEPMPATPTAPTVAQDQGAAVLSFGPGRIHRAVGTGAVLVTLLEEFGSVKMPAGQPPFAGGSLAEHAHRNRDQVRAFLDRAAAPAEGAK
ncbi:hypothetical protein AB0I93_00095 [Streptomyces sp. NPDC049967]|uniref:hypothetical protein n=1 Tax=Streptomyces sp. NPDC049967 TaxID=3155658 RepID=UPI00342581EE